MSLFSEPEPPPSEPKLPNSVDQKEANSYNERAVQLFQEGNFEEAQKLWEKALELLEQPGDHLTDGNTKSDGFDSYGAEILAASEEEGLDDERISGLYDAAISLFRKEKYVAAKSLFERINAAVPGYKATQNYLTILGYKVKRAEQDLSEGSFEKKVTARREERAEWNHILEASQIELRNKMAEQADPVYADALQYYKARDFKLAKEYFTEAAKISPHYKDTDRYLSRIEKDIRDEEQRLVEKTREQEALARKKEKEEWDRILNESEEELQEKLVEQVDPVYQEAVRYYKERQFELAKNRFEEAQLILPNYRSTIKYLGRIDKDIREEARLRQERRALSMERRKKEEELARKIQAKREAELHEAKEQERLQVFKEAAEKRQKEREEWLRVLAESEKERQEKLEAQAKFIYEEALVYYKKRYFEQAKQDFLEVRRVSPSYKSTEKYLARIDKDIEKERQEQREERERILQMKVRKKNLLEQKKWEEQQKLRTAEEERLRKEYQEKSLAREKQRQEWQSILEENERERQKRLEEEAEFVYREALDYYDAGRWQEAKADFLEAESILPGFKQAQKYLETIDQDIWNREKERRQGERDVLVKKKQAEIRARQEEEKRQARLQEDAERRELEFKKAQAQAVYRFATSLYKQGYYIQAKDKFLEVQNILANYKSTNKYLKRIDKDIAKEEEHQRIAFEQQIREQRLAQKREQEHLEEIQAAKEKNKLLKLREEALLRAQERKEWEKTVKKIEKEHRERLEEQTDSVYAEAMRYYDAGWLDQAKATLEEVNTMWPGYKSTDKYLQRIDSEIQKEIALRRESENEILKQQQKRKELAADQGNERRSMLQKDHQEERSGRLQAEALARQEEKNRLEKSMKRIQQEHEKKIREKAKSLYTQAIRYYKAKDFSKAEMAFIEVEKTLPGYRSTQKYLALIDQDIKEKQRTQGIDEGRKKYVEDQKDYASIRSQARSMEEDLKERQKEFSAKMEAKYREAVALYKAKEFIQAKMKFIEVESISPGYKGTLKYLRRIDKNVSRGQPVPAKEFKEGSPAEVRGRGRRDVIEQALSDVHGRPHDLKQSDDVSRSRLEQSEMEYWKKWIQSRREELRSQRLKVRKEYERQFRQLYDRAVKLYKNRRYEEARSLFSQIEQMKPGYKRASSYLKKANAKIRKGLQKEKDHNVVLEPQRLKTRTDVVNEVLNDLERRR